MKELLAAKGIVEYEGKVLLLREGKKYSEGTHIGELDFPGGRIAVGEHIEEALLREILEETGTIPKIENFLFSVTSPAIINGEKVNIKRNYFKCRAADNEIKLGKDHDEHIWINPLEYRKHKIIGNLSEVFEKYNQFGKK